MRRFILLLIIVLLAGGFAFWPATESTQRIKREPLQKSGGRIKSPTVYEKRERIESGRENTYDPKPRVEAVDADAGKYELKWIGYDGKEKTVVYQRVDAIDVVVSGSVEQAPDGSYVYKYAVENLSSSAAYVTFLALQNFSDDSRPTEVNGKPTTLADIRLMKNFRQAPDDGKPRNLENILTIGEMSTAIQRFKEGNWIAFGGLPELITPGSKFQVRLVSKAAPGLVGCSAAAGPRTMKGAGEHLPSELEAALPGYDAWPSGYTVGPVASLGSLRQAERVSYLVDKLGQFEKLGWITPAARRWYEKSLTTDLDGAKKRARSDLESDQISSEVFAMIHAAK